MSPVRPWLVVAGWGVLLGALAGISAAMGNSMVVLEISGGAAVLALAIAGALWLDERLRPSRGVFIMPVRLGGTFLFAVTAMTAWLSLAFGQYVLYLAVVPLTGAVLLEAAARRRPRWHR
jgi:predicted lysophospholipase L1 biosynthesis ABC-type transport system permease subunit